METTNTATPALSTKWILFGAAAIIVILLIAAITIIVLPTTAPSPIKPASVSITDNGFSPSTIKIKSGQSVTWTDSDSQPHAIMSTSNLDFSSDSPLAMGDTFTYTFANKGTYTYQEGSGSALVKGTVIVQ